MLQGTLTNIKNHIYLDLQFSSSITQKIRYRKDYVTISIVVHSYFSNYSFCQSFTRDPFIKDLLDSPFLILNVTSDILEKKNVFRSYLSVKKIGF